MWVCVPGTQEQGLCPRDTGRVCADMGSAALKRAGSEASGERLRAGGGQDTGRGCCLPLHAQNEAIVTHGAFVCISLVVCAGGCAQPLGIPYNTTSR